MKLAEISLKERWDALKEEQPRLRIRNAAELLGVSEMELLITQDGTTSLKPEFKDILGKMERLGEVMALTRNDSAVHEVKGVYDKPALNESMVGMFLGEWIDLRIFFQTWKYVFAANEGDRKSIQFFDGHGRAVHKIYLTEKSDMAGYDTLVREYAYSCENYDLDPIPVPEASTPPSQVDITAFRQGWLNMKDTHEFFGLIRKFGLSRTDALLHAPEGKYAKAVKLEAVKYMLEQASETQTPIMCFVGNPGMIQIYSGNVSRIVSMNEWLNVLDPRFNLHLKTPDIHSVWVVRKPSVDGDVTSMECFNSAGELVVQFFGKRKPGIPELESWRTIAANVEKNFAI